VSLIITAEKIISANVGDSRAILARYDKSSKDKLIIRMVKYPAYQRS